MESAGIKLKYILHFASLKSCSASNRDIGVSEVNVIHAEYRYSATFGAWVSADMLLTPCIIYREAHRSHGSIHRTLQEHNRPSRHCIQTG